MKYSCDCEESKEKGLRFFRRLCALLDENGNVLHLEEDDEIICAYCGEEAEEVDEKKKKKNTRGGRYGSAR